MVVMEVDVSKAASIMTNANCRHDNHRRAHYDHRGGHDDFRMTFVSRVSVPVAFRNKTSAGGKECDDAAQKKDFFHGVTLRGGRGLLYGV